MFEGLYFIFRFIRESVAINHRQYTMAVVALYTTYQELMDDRNVRSLLEAVSQNPNKETIDLDKSKSTLMACVMADKYTYLNAPRRKIATFLFEVYMKELRESIALEFWWEMKYRIQKLLTVSTVLEAMNLRDVIGASKLSNCDLPQAIVELWHRIETTYTDEAFEYLKSRYRKKTQLSPEMADLYENVFFYAEQNEI